MNVYYRSVGNRCAVNLDSLKLPIPHSQTLQILESIGFERIDVDIISLARKCMQTSKYRRGARPSEAPGIVDCSSLMKWLYGERGIWLPRRSIQQRELGRSISPESRMARDLVFVKGVFDWYFDDPSDGVGHVGIVTHEGTVIHACDSNVNVIESSFERFVSKLKFRGIRRYIPENEEVLTLQIPSTLDVETPDDLRWLVLQSLPR